MCSKDQGYYEPQSAKDIPQVYTEEDGFCKVREDNLHCLCWWGGKPCCACGFNGGQIDE